MYRLRAWGRYWAIVRVNQDLRVLEVVERYEDLWEAVQALKGYSVE